MSAIDWIFKLKRTWGLQRMLGWTGAKCPLAVNEQTTYWGYSRKVASLSQKSSPSYSIIPSHPNLLFCTEIFHGRIREPLSRRLLRTAGDVLMWSLGKSRYWMLVGALPSYACSTLCILQIHRWNKSESIWNPLLIWALGWRRPIFITPLLLTHCGDFNSTNTWEDR